MEDTPKVYSYARYSSLIQAKGYSLERQIKRAQEWCESRGLTLQESRSDEGKSAYHGTHISSGSLGRFLEDVKEGRIEPGSILLIEALDRLTRQNLHTAQGIVWGLLDAGIKIVTIGDDAEYSREQGLGGAVMLLVNLEASHQESERKSDRVHASWAKRLEKAKNGIPLGKGFTPSWLKFENGKFVVIPERVDLLREIFNMAIEGRGCLSIAAELNNRGLPTWGRGKQWEDATLHKMLRAKTVYGVLEASRRIKGESGKREVVEIQNYYPGVVEKEVFDKAQRAMKSRRLPRGKEIIGGKREVRAKGGRTGHFNNLFGTLATCGYCGSRIYMHLSMPKRGSKIPEEDWRRMVCNNARLGHGCKYSSFVYRHMEEAFLKFCNEVDYSKLVSPGKNKDLEAAREKARTFTDKIAEKESQVENELSVAALVRTPEMRDKFALRLDALQTEINSLKEQLEEQHRAVDLLSRSDGNIAERINVIRELSVMMQDPENRLETRRRMSYAIKEAVAGITVFAFGLQGRFVESEKESLEIITREPGFTQEQEQQLCDLLPADVDFDEAKAEILQAEQEAFLYHKEKTTGRDRACFLVKFRNGHARFFTWDKDNKRFNQTEVMTKDSYQSPELTIQFPDGKLTFF